jgi:long-chain fatty acid transport protein
MKRTLILIAGALITGSLFAGGLVTNTNQSASWVRLPSRNASTEIDAAYYNPAGLMKLDNGLHFSVSNQTIFQTRKIENSYAGPGGLYGLNEHTYTGTVKAPLFPSVYAVFKLDKFAFSAGFMPVGGGGGAEYERGLPSFEMGISDLVPGLATQGATGYKADIYFKGSSTFLGVQGAASYKINDMISVAVGARYVTAKNEYSGHLQSIQLNMGGTWTPALTVFNGIVSNLTSVIGIPATLAPALPAYGGLTLAQAQTGGILTAAQRTGIEAGLTQVIGLTQAQVNALTLNGVSATVTGATPTLTVKRATAAATATLVSDKTAEATQTGSGITPFISVNISPTENLNIAVKYEMATKLELTNCTTTDLLTGYTATGDSITQFPDGETTRNDMPAMFALGVEYRILPKLKIALGGNYYFDKTADYGHKVDADLNPQTPATHIANSDIIADNGMSIQGGLEYNLTDQLLVSAGYIYANKGVSSLYQSDMTFGNATQTFGGGGAFAVTNKIKINLGAAYTLYAQDTKTIDHIVSGVGNVQATESYKKSTFMVGLGLDISF